MTNFFWKDIGANKVSDWGPTEFYIKLLDQFNLGDPTIKDKVARPVSQRSSSQRQPDLPRPDSRRTLFDEDEDPSPLPVQYPPPLGHPSLPRRAAAPSSSVRGNHEYDGPNPMLTHAPSNASIGASTVGSSPISILYRRAVARGDGDDVLAAYAAQQKAVQFAASGELQYQRGNCERMHQYDAQMNRSNQELADSQARFRGLAQTQIDLTRKALSLFLSPQQAVSTQEDNGDAPGLIQALLNIALSLTTPASERSTYKGIEKRSIAFSLWQTLQR